MNNSTPQSCSELTYDIPTGAMANPSHKLEALGMYRLTKSVWRGTTAAMALLPLDEWVKKGCVVTLMKYELGEWEKCRAAAEVALNNELNRFREFMDQQIATAEKWFAQAEAEQSAKLTAKARWILRRALNDGHRRIKSAQATLLMFDLLNTRADLLEAFKATSDAYFAAHEARAWLKRSSGRTEKLEQLELPTEAEAEPVVEDALDFLSGTGLRKVKP